jgi:hypothetical protein
LFPAVTLLLTAITVSKEVKKLQVEIVTFVLSEILRLKLCEAFTGK